MITLTCPRCAASFPSVAELYDHRMAPVDNGLTGQPCQPRYGQGTPQSPAPVVYDIGGARCYSWLCPPGQPSGIGDSAGPVLVTARLAVVVPDAPREMVAPPRDVPADAWVLS